jgi:hypothetical protein
MMAVHVYGAYVAIVAALLAALRFEWPARFAKLWPVLVLSAGAAVFAISEPLTSPFEDFVEAYRAGGQAALNGPEAVAASFSEGVGGFVNLPILSLLFVPFALLDEAVGAVVFLVLGVAATIAAWNILRQELQLDTRAAAILAALFAVNGPLMNSLKEGNTTHIALLGIVLGWRSLRRGRAWRAGVIIGAVSLLKLPLLLFGVYAVVRGHWRMATGGAVVLALAVGSSLAVFGVDVNAVWFDQVVLRSGQVPLGAFNVQSPSALMLRFEEGASVLCDWDGAPLSGSGRMIAMIFGLGAFALPVAAAFARRSRGAGGTALFQDIEYASVGLVACLAGPLAWSHYYAWALLPLALLVGQRRPNGAAAMLYLAVAMLSAPVVRACDSGSGPFALLLVSHYYLGGVLLLGYLAAASVSKRPEIGTGH